MLLQYHLFEFESDMMGAVFDKALVLKILLSSNHFARGRLVAPDHFDCSKATINFNLQ